MRTFLFKTQGSSADEQQQTISCDLYLDPVADVPSTQADDCTCYSEAECPGKNFQPLISLGCFIEYLDWVYGSCDDGTWTEWTSRDDPADGLDDESVWKYRDLDGVNICDGNAPTSTEARVINTQEDYTETGQTLSINPATGLTCQDVDGGQTCEDYEVRFCCP